MGEILPNCLAGSERTIATLPRARFTHALSADKEGLHQRVRVTNNMEQYFGKYHIQACFIMNRPTDWSAPEKTAKRAQSGPGQAAKRRKRILEEKGQGHPAAASASEGARGMGNVSEKIDA